MGNYAIMKKIEKGVGMMQEERNLPIGIQSFEKLREEGFIYVDKTAFVYRIAHIKVQFFLSRPRRFGKSLFLSTLRAYWEGKKNLFKGLEIEKLEENNPDAWKKYPVFYFDFNGKDYTKNGALEEKLSAILGRLEKEYDCLNEGCSPEERFENLLITAYEKTGLHCIVLVDEYDKPLLETVDNKELQEHNKAVFKGFFGILKSSDEYIKSVFITGVTKFHKISIFSDLNQLTDISLSEEFSGICGITEAELRTNFAPEIAAMTKKRNIPEEECFKRLKKQYDGYRFCRNGVNVYNPFSLMNALFYKEFGSYWFRTGTPTFLLKVLRNSRFDVRKFTNKTIYATESILQDYTGDEMSPIPLLYQSGYLTIDEYNEHLDRYTLCFPNEEVKYGLINSLMPSYVPDVTKGNGLDIFSLENYIESGSLDEIRNYFTALFASITYTSSETIFEHYFQTVMYLAFTLLGQYVLCEMHTFTGRIDCKVETDKFIYLFEFKRDESAENALKQIEDKSYDLPFAADNRKIYKIGVSFDSEKRILSDWKVAE